MNRTLTAALWLSWSWLGMAGAVADTGLVSVTRSALEQWVQTRQLAARTRADWQSEKDILEQSIRLFERELQSLSNQLASVTTNRTQLAVEREAMLTQLEELNAAAEATRELAAALEQHVLSLAPAFPPPLQEKVQPLLERIPAEAATTKAGLLTRIQNLVALLNEVNKFNATVTVVSEVRKNPAGTEVQVETVYVGLAQAYFVDKTGGYAGMGIPSKQGWQWVVRNDLAERIQKAIAVYKNAAPAVFVALPVQIQ